MANSKHLTKLKKGVGHWNKWRRQNAAIKPALSGADLGSADLSGADLSGADLSGADLSGANLSVAALAGAHFHEANLRGANLSNAGLFRANLQGVNLGKANLGGAFLHEANLSKAFLRKANLSKAFLAGANLSGANLRGADLRGAKLPGANLPGANLLKVNLARAKLSGAELRGANLREAKLTGAHLFEANLSGASLIDAQLENANLTSCFVYGISVWNVDLKGAIQSNLRITRYDEPVIEVDDIKIAQFVYLLLNNDNIRDVIGTIGRKGVLILGRFTEERKLVLDAIRNKLRDLGLIPMMFDFERSEQRNFTETIRILAGLSRFIIADITKPKSSPIELQATVPDYMIPFAPIIQAGEEPFAMFQDLQNQFDWVLDVFPYDSIDDLISNLEEEVIDPALKKGEELQIKKNQPMRIRRRPQTI